MLFPKKDSKKEDKRGTFFYLGNQTLQVSLILDSSLYLFTKYNCKLPVSLSKHMNKSDCLISTALVAMIFESGVNFRSHQFFSIQSDC